MEISLHEITIRDLANGYVDEEENGVWGYGGKLNIRPQYQREFVYKDKQRDAVIDTVIKNFPLNVMYWSVNEDGTYEIIDGQQRTISICQYVGGDFSVEYDHDVLAFHNLPKNVQEDILNYKLMVYFCKGTDSERLKWFETINIAGEELTSQELRNAVYSGPWLSDAKRYFSKKQCVAYKMGGDYLVGVAERQKYLETAIKWISIIYFPDIKDDDKRIKTYMSTHQNDANALKLWSYFQSVITWVEATFIKKRKKWMNGVEWGYLYNEFKDNVYNPKQIEMEIQKLMLDDDVTNKKGIYTYVLTRKEKYLSIRAFSDAQRQAAYERQHGICPICGGHFELAEMDADHIKPWSEGGHTLMENCQMLCKECNRRKGKK